MQTRTAQGARKARTASESVFGPQQTMLPSGSTAEDINTNATWNLHHASSPFKVFVREASAPCMAAMIA